MNGHDTTFLGWTQRWDSTFSVHEIDPFRTGSGPKTCIISVLSIPIFSPSKLGKDLPVLFAHFDSLQQVGPVLQGLLQRHPSPPSPDRLMVPADKRLWNCNPHKVRWPRVMRIIEQPSGPIRRSRGPIGRSGILC